MRTKERITDTQGSVTVSPESSITVKLEDSKDQLKNISVIVGIISVIVGIIVSGLTFLISWKVSVHTEQVEEAKQLHNYLDKINEIIVSKNSQQDSKKTIEFIDNRPTFAFKLARIKEIDYLTRTYTRKLNRDSRRVVLIYLYESGLINHTKATGFEAPGQEGICRFKDYKKKIKKDNILVESNTFNIDTYPYCNLSTNRYYFDDVDMSGIFLKHIKLHNSYLNRANFNGANLISAEFRNSGFRGANFTNARLEKVDFSSPYSGDITALNGANFTGANLSEANLTNTDLTDTVFGDNKCTQENRKNDKNLNCANLYKANLTGAKINNPNEITKAYNWWTARYDSEIENQLPLSEEQKQWREKNIN
ncbi:MAG: pentapeptide repeat-containing protein [Crocosphaera sp.]|nr:pentapeptide repeat-containing protein [Crocosphaera sp.]